MSAPPSTPRRPWSPVRQLGQPAEVAVAAAEHHRTEHHDEHAGRLTSIAVMTTFARSDSLIPRALSAATSARKTSAAGTGGTSRNIAEVVAGERERRARPR